MSKKILVTGGAGFVGSHTVDALLREGHSVRVIDNLSEQVHHGAMPAYLSKDVEFLRGDVRDPDALRNAVSGVDVVYHFAAAVGVGQSMYEISRYMEINTQGTANLLQAVLDRNRPLEKLIIASSMSIYGEGQYRCEQHGMVAPPPRPTEQLKARQWQVPCPECGRPLGAVATAESKPLQCSSIYALGKKDQEEMGLLFGRTYGVPVVALRYFNIYGTRQALSNPYTGVAAIFASRLLNGRAPMIFEDGGQLRDFVSVHDVVQANLLAMQRSEADGHALNIGSGEQITICDIANVLSATLGVQVPAEITGKYRAGDIRHCFGDISLAQRLLGYSPRHTLQSAVGELAEWLRSQSSVDRVEEASSRLVSYGLTA
ncbi:MAG TPA: SDR family NAD(P)-dependent oxidoreductase [Candidatus Saccharimonadales bacterium]|nr:SDR family NAD(P)-dependent oxidoreductase [Candidatus Saccharimonadales bacterium]